MYMTLDMMAQRYHRLPSELLAQANTIDYYVMDNAIRYEQEQKRKASGKAGAKAPPNLTPEQMQAMLAKTKRKK